jgi:dCMP deaminase
VRLAPRIFSPTDPELDEKNILARALESSRASKDPSTQVGAVTFLEPYDWYYAHNTLCPGSPDRWYEDRELKYAHIVHAEQSLVAALGGLLRGRPIAVTHFPCGDCAKLLAAARVGQVLALKQVDYETRWADSVRTAQNIFNRADIPYRVYERK